MKQCPLDGRWMNPISLYGIGAHACPGCGAIWFPDDTLQELGKMSNSTLESADDQVKPSGPKPVQSRTLKCPDDGSFLYSFQFDYNSGVTLDQCPECGGILVEDGELAAIAEARANPTVRTGRQDQPPPLPTDAREAEVKKAVAELEAKTAANRTNAKLARVDGAPVYHPGWWLAAELASVFLRLGTRSWFHR